MINQEPEVPSVEQMITEPPSFIFALDFDGVICDSVGETAISGWEAGKLVWPGLIQGDLPKLLSDDFCTVRPVLKTGYESILLLKMLMDGHTVGMVLSDHALLKEQILTDTKVSVENLKEHFSRVRENWIERDFDSWLKANEFYEGTVNAVNATPFPAYIITTKEKRFTDALCEYAHLQIPAERIYGLESGPKSETLAQLRRMYPEATIVFLEDKIQSIVDKNVVIGNLRRVFAEWGYCTSDERGLAQDSDGITSVVLNDFPDLLLDPLNFFT